MSKINKKLLKDQSGIGHLALIAVIVVVLAVFGVAGARVYQNNQGKTAGGSTPSTTSKKYDDQRVDDKVLSNLKGTEENEQ